QMSQQEIARRRFRDAELHGFIHGLADNGQAGPQHGFRKHWLENGHLFRSAAVRDEYRSVDSTCDPSPSAYLSSGPCTSEQPMFCRARTPPKKSRWASGSVSPPKTDGWQG